MATQFSMNEWNSEDRIAYLRNQAQIKFLEQEKQMMLLRAEVPAIQEQEKAPAVADREDDTDNETDHVEGDDDDDSEDEQSWWLDLTFDLAVFGFKKREFDEWSASSECSTVRNLVRREESV